MSDFAQLGIPFPLFEGPLTDACDYLGIVTCQICGASDQHCFGLGIGCDVMIGCPSCGTENGLDASERAVTSCVKCDASIEFPIVTKSDEIRACYACLRAGKAAITKDTEFGMVAWEHATKGMTHGVPRLKTSEFELVNTEDDWVSARIPQPPLFELLRTPSFHTWQGDIWLFCCKQPMTYRGEWNSFAANLHRQNADEILDHVLNEYPEESSWIGDEKRDGSDGVSLYMFHCKLCDNHRCNWDMD